MSDIMLFGVLRMPYNMVMGDEMSRLQFYHRARQAADRLENLDSDKIKQLALIHSQQCMAHHGTGPEVQAAWIELCKAIDLGQP